MKMIGLWWKNGEVMSHNGMVCVQLVSYSVISAKIYLLQVREQAISTCGYLCVGQPEIPHKKKILEAFLALAKEVSVERNLDHIYTQ